LKHGITVHVGSKPTEAKYRLRDVPEARKALWQVTNAFTKGHVREQMEPMVLTSVVVDAGAS